MKHVLALDHLLLKRANIMKHSLGIGLFRLLLLVAGAHVYSAEFFVSPTGDDAAAGSIEHPFATIQRAQQAAAPGDTVLIRGGTYRMQESQIVRRKDIYAYITVLERSGTLGMPITYRAYNDEKPVFDCSLVKPEGLRVVAFYVSGSWLHLQGLEVTGVQVTMKVHTQSICFENDGSHNIYERLLMHDGQAIGIYSVRGSDNLFLNCDAWNNWECRWIRLPSTEGRHRQRLSRLPGLVQQR
jgi:hypothetical protein